MMPGKPVRAVAIVSGGMDSTTMLYAHVKNQEEPLEIIHTVSFNYGQRHKKELEYAQHTSETLHIPWTCIDLWSSGLTEALSDSGSSLVTGAEVPEGHYAADNMKSTVVPNRNMMMLSIAGAIAVAKDAPLLLTGVHAGDHFIYPDCRPDFIRATSRAFQLGNVGFGPFKNIAPNEIDATVGGIYAPFLYVSKEDIARTAIENSVPFHETWSCYKGDTIHCGRCGTCVERLEAINGAAVSMGLKLEDVDQTEYADTSFWKEAVANAS